MKFWWLIRRFLSIFYYSGRNLMSKSGQINVSMWNEAWYRVDSRKIDAVHLKSMNIFWQKLTLSNFMVFRWRQKFCVKYKQVLMRINAFLMLDIFWRLKIVFFWSTLVNTLIIFFLIFNSKLIFRKSSRWSRVSFYSPFFER